MAWQEYNRKKIEELQRANSSKRMSKPFVIAVLIIFIVALIII